MALCINRLHPKPCANLVQPLEVPVREPLHLEYRADVWFDRMGLYSHAVALRARADIEVCVCQAQSSGTRTAEARPQLLVLVSNELLTNLFWRTEGEKENQQGKENQV